jgi:hypothetical protein
MASAVVELHLEPFRLCCMAPSGPIQVGEALCSGALIVVRKVLCCCVLFEKINGLCEQQKFRAQKAYSLYAHAVFGGFLVFRQLIIMIVWAAGWFKC